jgi:hypothetical protein
MFFPARAVNAGLFISRTAYRSARNRTTPNRRIRFHRNNLLFS